MADQSFDVRASAGSAGIVVAAGSPDGPSLQVAIDSASGPAATAKDFTVHVIELDECHEPKKTWWTKQFTAEYPWKQEADVTVVGLDIFKIAVEYSNGNDVLHVVGKVGPIRPAPVSTSPKCSLQASSDDTAPDGENG